MSITYAQNVGLVKTPPIAKIGNNIYRTVQIGSRVWIAENLKEDISGVTSHVWKGNRYYNKNNSQKNTINNFLGQYGFRYPTEQDYAAIGVTASNNPNTNLIKSVIATGDVWDNQGTGETTLNILPNKDYVVNIGHELPTDLGEYWVSFMPFDGDWLRGIEYINGKFKGSSVGNQPDSYEFVVRAVKDA